jgi:hypothetical protein
MVMLTALLLLGATYPGSAFSAPTSGDPGPHGSAFRAASTSPGYLTIVFAKTQWVATEKCVPLPNAVALDQVAASLRARGRAATGSIVIDRIQDSEMFCQLGYTLHPNWSQIANLRDQYGWSFTSYGAHFRDMTELTEEGQRTESCGSLEALRVHGHTRAWGLFSYPSNRYTDQIQANVVSTCFAFGRRYGSGVNLRSNLVQPWFQRTTSVSGGACNNPAAPCYDTAAVGLQARYTPRTRLATLMRPGADAWDVVQMYRLVKGTYSSASASGPRWDCSSPDWRNHWANRGELYCYADFISAVNQIPATAVLADPATVAEAWGRLPPSLG